MRVGIVCMVISVAVIIASCKKEHGATPGTPPSASVKKVLLKDITIPSLPSPYYHLEYGPDSGVAKISFASGFTMYDVFYNGNNISEMRNNIIVNHDTLRYSYDNAGKIVLIKFINEANITYRHIVFSYNGQQVKEINWDGRQGNGDFMIDRTVTLTYFADGNVKEINDHRPGINNQPGTNIITQFDQYDDKVNVDDFTLLQNGYHDHLFLLPGLRMQKNNPRKETFTSEGVAYVANYTYTYKNDGTPLTKMGDVLFSKGAPTGQRFQSTTIYSYY